MNEGGADPLPSWTIDSLHLCSANLAHDAVIMCSCDTLRCSLAYQARTDASGSLMHTSAHLRVRAINHANRRSRYVRNRIT
jgi:hypothetical protein